ncbi:hypothetical protein QBC43DRAFT_331154 [Cladorrhinum sp. PSN259]|nr:hypothetical protein QBC43DRAFT_331154 [Cladorrhinum sp. PSN259]
MNFNESHLIRSNRGRLRKPNPTRERQREYFARAGARAAAIKGNKEGDAAPVSQPKNGPSPSKRRPAVRKRPGPSPARRQAASKKLGSSPRGKLPPHILSVGDGALKRKLGAAVTGLRREDVRIRIGSQEKRPGPSSPTAGKSIASKSNTGRSSGSRRSSSHSTSEAQFGKPRKSRLPSTNAQADRRLSSRPQAEGRTKKPLQPLSGRKRPLHCNSRDDQVDRNKRYCTSRDADGQILSTSAPVLAHPMAQRVSISLRHLDSENTDSVAAHVGRAIPNIPTSQQDDNNKWRTWLQQPPSIVSTHRAAKRYHDVMEEEITPGVSEWLQSRDSSPARLPQMADSSTPCPVRGVVSDVQHITHFSSSSDTSAMLARYEELKRRMQEFECHEHVAHFGDNSDDAQMEQEEMAQYDIVLDEPEAIDEVTIQDSATNSCINQRYSRINPVVSPKTTPTQDKSARPRPQIPIRYMGTRQNRRSVFTKDSVSNYDNSTTQHESIKPKQPDAAEAWRTFVFGDENSDELESAAFARATHEAARNYRTFNRAKLTNEKTGLRWIKPSEQDMKFKTAGFRSPTEVSASVNFRPRTESPDTTPQAPSIEVDMSSAENFFNDICPDDRKGVDVLETAHNTGLRAKSPSLLVHMSSGNNVVSCLEPSHIVERIWDMESRLNSPGLIVNISSSDSVETHETHDFGPAGIVESFSRLESQLKVPSPSLEMSMTAENGFEAEANQRQLHEQPQPRGAGTSAEQFRFAPPKLFVGSRSNTQPQHGATFTIERQRGRGRQKKRALDGRANIRALPNYTSDPIEDFDEAVQQPGQSMFPPLDFA